MSNSALIVVSHANWVSEDFAPAAPFCDVIKDYGFDVPDAVRNYYDVSWWMPTAHAARLQRIGLAKNLISPGPAWLDTLPSYLTLRNIKTERLKDFYAHGYKQDDRFFIKPAEMKLDEFPASYMSVSEVSDAGLRSRMHDHSMIQYTDRLININHEYRLHILHGIPVTVSPYLVDGVTYYDGANDNLRTEAIEFATYATGEISNQPASYVLDIAMDMDAGEWFVLEGNPAWSSAIYGCDPVNAYHAISRSCKLHPGDEKFLWEPDIYLKNKAEKKVPLK